MESSFPNAIKFIESNCHVEKKKSGRAITGLSMGDFHSLHISKQYPDTFDYVGSFSAAILPREGFESPVYRSMDEKLRVQFGRHPELYWTAIGKTDFLYKNNVGYRKKLDDNGYRHEYYEGDDGHIWENWRIYLTKFASMLLK